MGSQYLVHGIDVHEIARFIKKGAELLQNLSIEEERDNVIHHTIHILFQQALRGDEVSCIALYLLDPDEFDRVEHIFTIHTSALDAFEDRVPDLAGSIPAEVTQDSVRRLFFALLGVSCYHDAFAYLEHMWQYFSWNIPKKMISASTFSTVFSVLMAKGNRDDAHRLLEDADSDIDWNDFNQEQSPTAEAAMQIFSVFLSRGKYALAKRVITAIEPHIDFQSFLKDLEADAEKSSLPSEKETEKSEIQEEQEQSTVPAEEHLKSPFEDLALQIALEAEVPASPSLPKPILSALASVTVKVPQVVNESPIAIPVNPDYPFSFSLPVWNEPDSPIGTVTMLNENLYDMLVMLKNDGVGCLHDIPLTVSEFKAKFPRYSDSRYDKRIERIVKKVSGTLENPQNYRRPFDFSVGKPQNERVRSAIT